MYTSRFSSYLFQTTHLFKTTPSENAPFEECNQRWLGSRDRVAPLHLSLRKQNPSSVWRKAGDSDGGSCDFTRPCLNSTPMLCGVHNYWRPCVTIWCLLGAATSVSTNMSACNGSRIVNRQSYLESEYQTHKLTPIIWDLQSDVHVSFWTIGIHFCFLLFYSRQQQLIFQFVIDTKECQMSHWLSFCPFRALSYNVTVWKWWKWLSLHRISISSIT